MDSPFTREPRAYRLQGNCLELGDPGRVRTRPRPNPDADADASADRTRNISRSETCPRGRRPATAFYIGSPLIWQATGVPADARTRTRTRTRNAKRDYFAPPPGEPLVTFSRATVAHPLLPHSSGVPHLPQCLGFQLVWQKDFKFEIDTSPRACLNGLTHGGWGHPLPDGRR